MDALEGRVVSLRLIFNRKSVRTVRAEPTIFTEIMILRPSTALIGPEPAGIEKVPGARPGLGGKMKMLHEGKTALKNWNRVGGLYFSLPGCRSLFRSLVAERGGLPIR